MFEKAKPIVCVLSLIVVSSSLQGCVAAALAPTALTLAAEGVSVHSTGQTITENLKDAILKSKAEGGGEYAKRSKAGAQSPEIELASRQLAPLPPRKPTPPNKSLVLMGQANTIGNFVN